MTIALVVVAALLTCPAFQDRPFSSLSAAEKRAALNELLKGLSPNTLDRPAPAHAAGLIREGLEDEDANVRRTALGAAHGLSYLIKLRAKQWPEEARREQTALNALIPRLTIMLSDADWRIREQVVRTLGSVDSVLGPRGAVFTSADTLKRFATMFSTEPHGGVRATIMNTFSLMSEHRTDIGAQAVIEAGLNDTHPGVLQHAASGVGRAKLPHLLPRLVPLLKHPDRGVRLDAAVAFGMLPADSAAFIAELQRAADSELEHPIKQTLLAAIRLAREKGKR
jgi:HEAT repeat protein